MNYLGHAFLSFGDAEVLTGNMTGDHIKGKLVLDTFPPGIRKGVLLHRKIDGFADVHPATQRAKLLFREHYGLYAGAIMDTLYDHYLANDPKHFSSQEVLKQFSTDTYNKLETQSAYFPASFTSYFSYMKEHDWLYNYRTLQGMQRSLQGLARRATHMPPPDKAYEIFVTYYYQLAQCYYEFIDDVITFAKFELNGH